MEIKEFKVPIPEGMEIDKGKSTFECIKFKPIELKRWRDDETADITGYFIDANSELIQLNVGLNRAHNHNAFATKKQAKSALAMAQISQIMANDKRFGGVVTDKEWNAGIDKYIIERMFNTIETDWCHREYCFLAFHTAKQRDLFLKENEDLVKAYLMID